MLQQPIAERFGTVQVARRVLTAAEIIGFDGVTGLAITPAPPDGYVVIPLSITGRYRAGATPFANGTGTGLVLSRGLIADGFGVLANNAFLTTADDRIAMSNLPGDSGVYDPALLIPGGAIVIGANAFPTYTAGDGTLEVTTVYILAPL